MSDGFSEYVDEQVADIESKMKSLEAMTMGINRNAGALKKVSEKRDRDNRQRRIDLAAVCAMQAICAGDGAQMVANRDSRFDETNWSFIVASNAYDFAYALEAERQRRIDAERKGGEA